MGFRRPLPAVRAHLRSLSRPRPVPAHRLQSHCGRRSIVSIPKRARTEEAGAIGHVAMPTGVGQRNERRADFGGPAGSSGGIKIPRSPLVTISGIPPTLLATTGQPAAMASMTTLPNGSERVGSAKTSNVRMKAGTSRRYPTNRTCAPRPRLFVSRTHSSSYSIFVWGRAADNHQKRLRDARDHFRHSGDQGRHALARNDLPDESDDRP